METVHTLRIEHGTTNMSSFPQRQPSNHRPNHAQPAEHYKPSRSPLQNPSRYPYPGSPQMPPASSHRQFIPSGSYQQQQQQQQQQPQQQQQQQQPPPPSSYHRDYRPARISLLHSEYATRRDLQGVHHVDVMSAAQVSQSQTLNAANVQQVQAQANVANSAQQQQPFKKIRLQDQKEVQQPLRIDTRPGAYNPQVEAISPTLPDIIQQEDQAFKTTKDELLQQIGKVDREIAKAESQISILKKKEAELEELASKPSTTPETEEDAQPKHQSLAQKIYAENRKLAMSAHALLDPLGPKIDWPIYNQPSDTPQYAENQKKHQSFKKNLQEYFKKRHAEKAARNNYLAETYSKLMQEWLRKVEKVESSSKRKAKEAKNRDFFEKQFPELRKQREDKERFNRVGSRVKSEADMEEIMDNLQEQALEDKKMRSYAVIPPILLDARDRRTTFLNNNGHIVDMEQEYKSRQHLNVWSPSEKEIFREKYLQHPKNFGAIASYIDRKNVMDCVQYYYLSKKTENYKQLLRKSRQRTRSSRNNPQKSSNTITSVVDSLTTGVTTRLQREQQQKIVVQQNRDLANIDAAPVSSSSSSSSSVSASTNPVVNNTISQQQQQKDTTCNVQKENKDSNLISTTTTNIIPNLPSNTSVVVVSTPGGTGTVTGVVVSSSTASAITSCSSSSLTLTSSSSSSSVITSTVSSSSTQPSTTSTSSDGVVFAVDGTSSCGEISAKVSDFNSFEDAYRGKKLAAMEDNVKSENNGLNGANGHDSSSTNNAANNLTPNHLTIKKEPVDDNGGGPSEQFGHATQNEKKKKDRRKDKENACETSEDETMDTQDKSVQGQCTVCNSQLGPQLQSRPLLPSHASQYGLREEQVPPNARVCNPCRCKCVRSRYTHCPLSSCPNSRGRVKRLRSLPQRLQELPPEIKDSLYMEFHIMPGTTKCCSACFNKIQRRLGPVEDWPDEEVAQLRAALTDLGANWQAIGERLNKPSHQVRNFYAANRKRLVLEQCLGDRKPALTDEEESGSSTSSCEEPVRERHSSDTASAESPPATQEQPQNPIKKEDYDSSATETADEGQTPDHYQDMVSLAECGTVLASATITPVNSDGQPRPNSSPKTVKDLMLNVIEISLMKNAGPQNPHNVPPTSGITPTISSILNNDSNEVTIVSEYNLNSQPGSRQQRNDLNIAKLLNPLIGATITPVPGPPIQQEALPRTDDLVVLQVQDGREPETLDLSIKKPRELPAPTHVKIPQIHRSESAAYITGGYHAQQQQQQQERNKSPAVYVARGQPKLPSPKPANPKTGSITLGTPIISQPRYDGILRQMPPEVKMGSITQGTPIHHHQDKRLYDFHYGKRSGAVLQNVGQVPPQAAAYSHYRQPAYLAEHQLSSRQTIMNDYITSQQMHARRTEKAHYLAAAAQSSPHRTPPPPQPQQQQRQGVIQRHTPRPMYPPGHEALSSLVDVAVQQPSLPVPSAPHEGLGKTIADNILEQPHRFQMMQQMRQQHQQQQQRLDQERRAYHQQQAAAAAAAQQQAAAAARQQQQQQQVQCQRSDSSTLTAASLIDAIITHQINQSEGGREVSNSREPTRPSDRLFQGFQRGDQNLGVVPPSSSSSGGNGDNNGERSPSVISVDLDSDGVTVNKNLTVKELTDTVISHDFSSRQPSTSYYHSAESVNESWKRRMQQQQAKEDAKRSGTPQQQQQQQQQAQQQQQPQDERQIIRVASQQKYHMEQVASPEANHWPDPNFRRYQNQPQSHLSAFEYVKTRIEQVMRTEDDKKQEQGDNVPSSEKERSDSPGEMVIDEEKHDDFPPPTSAQGAPPPASSYSYPYMKEPPPSSGGSQNEQQQMRAPPEPKPLLSAQYEPLSDED